MALPRSASISPGIPRSRRSLVGLFSILALLPPIPSSAQEPGRGPFRFSLEGALAGSRGGPGSSFGSMLIERGFDDRAPSLGFGPLFELGSDRTAERVDDPRKVYMGSARLRFGDRWSIAAFVNGDDAVAAWGYRDPGHYLRLRSATSTVAFALGFGVVPGLDVSVGPALYQRSVEELGGGRSRTVMEEQVLGFLIDAGVEVPLGRRFFFRPFAQYRGMPDTGVPEISLPDVFGAEEAFRFGAFDLPGNHWVGGVGVGIRF